VRGLFFSEPLSKNHFCSGKKWLKKKKEKCHSIADGTEVWLKTWHKEVLEAFSFLELIM